MATDLRSDRYALEPSSGSRCEIILLRHGDLITSPNTNGSLSCVWLASEVQVNSSAAELAHDEISGDKIGIADTPEDETEDEAAPEETITEVPVTQPVTQPTKSQPSATPRLLDQGSTLVQETPTFDRMIGMTEYSVTQGNEDRHKEPSPLPPGVVALTETFSTARTGQSPQGIMQNASTIELPTDRKRLQNSPEVRVNGRPSRKRQSPTSIPEGAPSAESRPTKRVKNMVLDGDAEAELDQPSPLDDINADPSRKTYSAKGKRRNSQIPDLTPSKLVNNSQRSTTLANSVAYEGEPPRVAFSNSAITNASPSLKFLRKHGGTLVTSVEDKCNILWCV